MEKPDTTFLITSCNPLEVGQIVGNANGKMVIVGVLEESSVEELSLEALFLIREQHPGRKHWGKAELLLN